MAAESWRNRSPGDLSVVFPKVYSGNFDTSLAKAFASAREWARTPLQERIECLGAAKNDLIAAKDGLAHGIAAEVGKPITEAHGEVAAVIAKFDLTIKDAQTHLSEKEVNDGPHPSMVRRRARGVAAVVGPFNFPLHLGHGANVAHLLAGNPVVYKPSPLAANVAAVYGAIMERVFPEGVFTLLQGGGAVGEVLCCDPRVRSVCFTGSVPVGRALARSLAGDLSKDVALELGGSNALIVCADADLEKAAQAAAEGACLTAGQRCNATSRVIVQREVADDFIDCFLQAIRVFRPGNPLDPATRLGPVVSKSSVDRYLRLTETLSGDWLLPGGVEPEVNGKRGHYVRPAVLLSRENRQFDTERFVPIVTVQIANDLDDAVRIQSSTPYGLTTSVFTRSEKTFRTLGKELDVGNLYANLPTTFSPSTLPFGGLRDSGNGRPGGRWFIRFTTDEQAVQWAKW